jgi:membrane-associated PAP2 superfamily phosphatase
MLWAGLSALALLTLVFNLTSLDITIQSRLYFPGANGGPWPIGNGWTWWALYHYGTLPGVVAGVGAILAFGASFASPRWLRFRFPSLFLILVMVIGPGLVVNGIGKGLFGRPRPADLVMFGGMWDFLPPFVPGIPGRGRSFLCGHCSPGFFFMSFFFLLSGWRKWAALAAGALLGLAMGTARILQGSHFTSDVLLCGAVMLVIQSLLAPVSRRTPDATRAPMSRMRIAMFTALFAVAGILVALLSAPVYKEERFIWRESGNSAGILREDKVRAWPGNPGRKLSLEISMREGDAVLRLSRPQEPLTIHSTVKGFGFPGAWRKWEVDEDAKKISWRIVPTGLYSEFNGRVETSFSPSRISGVSIHTGGGAVAIRLDGYPGRINLSFSGKISGQPAGFTEKGPGKWFRAGRPGAAPVVVEVSADSVTVIP